MIFFPQLCCQSRCCLVQHAKMQISCAPDAGSALHAPPQRHGEKPRALWPPCFCIANKTGLRWAHQLLLVQLYKLLEHKINANYITLTLQRSSQA